MFRSPHIFFRSWGPHDFLTEMTGSWTTLWDTVLYRLSSGLSLLETLKHFIVFSCLMSGFLDGLSAAQSQRPSLSFCIASSQTSYLGHLKINL